MPCLSDLVVERRNTSNAPYSQNEQQKESSFLKEFYEYQKKQLEEVAEYSQTSAADINKASASGRYLVQPAANTNNMKSSDEYLLNANPTDSKDVSYDNLKTRNIQLPSKEYNLKTANITLSDTSSDIYKALITREIPENNTFAKLYGQLFTSSLGSLFEQGVGKYNDWHTSPFIYSTADGVIERPLSEKSNVSLYNIVSDNQYNSKYDYYSLAYKNRSAMTIGNLNHPTTIYQAVNVYKEALYDYYAVLQNTTDADNIVAPIIHNTRFPIYQPSTLFDEKWNLSRGIKLTTEANLSSVGIYNPIGAWEADEQAFFHRIPLLGDLQQKLSDLEGSSILWQAFYNKKSTDPLQIYKLANVNTNVIYMTGRFIPQPPITNDVRFVSDMVPSALGGKVAGAVGELMGGIPSYPYIPLPYAMPQYQLFTISQKPENFLDAAYPFYIEDEQNDLLHFGGARALEYSRKLSIIESAKKTLTQFVSALNWDADALTATSKYRNNGWQPQGDLKSKDFFNKDAQKESVPTYYPSDFGYNTIRDFEGHTTIYDLQIEKPANLPENLPEFACTKDGTWGGRSLAYFTSITAIPEAELKNNNTYQLGEFGSFLLSLNYQNYISSIQTKTIETAECDCYNWGKRFIEYFYGSSEPMKYKHRSLYKSYYNIIISKIYYAKNNNWPITRIVEQRTFLGVPSFNLTEPVQENKLQEIQITWNIIGQDSTSVLEQNVTKESNELAGLSFTLENQAIA